MKRLVCGACLLISCEAPPRNTSEPEAGGTTDTSGSECVLAPDFACPSGTDCMSVACGDRMSRFSADGCLRPACPCGSLETCFTPAEHGGCAASTITCAEDPGSGCVCTSTDDCSGSYCVGLDEAFPCIFVHNPDYCDELPGCEWIPGEDLISSGDHCTTLINGGLCAPESDIGPGPVLYYRTEDPGRAFELPYAIVPLPEGMAACDCPGQNAACDCGC